MSDSSSSARDDLVDAEASLSNLPREIPLDYGAIQQSSNSARDDLVDAEASLSDLPREIPPDYGAIQQRSDVVEVMLDSSLFRVSVNPQRQDPASGTSNGSVSSPNRRMRLLALRTHMEMMLAFTLLRRKYLDRVLVSAYFALLIGLTPLGIYLFIQDRAFSSFYLFHAKIIHFVVQTLNIVLLYLYISTGLNFRALFTSAGLNPLLGNVLIAACSGALLAVVCVDRVAVYINSAYNDNHYSFIPQSGTTPDSLLFIIMAFVSSFAVAMAIVNGIHLLYFGFEFRRAMEGALEHVRDVQHAEVKNNGWATLATTVTSFEAYLLHDDHLTYTLMAPRILLSSTIPVILLPPDAPRTLTSTAPTTDLTALLTHSPAEDSVTLTLSDLSTRLLLLRHALTAAHYAPLRESQSLLIDFAAFPTHLCDLLQRAAAADDYVATLRLPEILNSGTDSIPVMTAAAGINVEQAMFSIIQTSAVKSITHIELQLRRASHEELMAAVAGRAREAELADARAAHLQCVLDEERGRARDDAARASQKINELSDKITHLEHEVADASVTRDRSVQLSDEVQRLREELNERDGRIATMRADMTEMSKANEENDQLRTASDRANTAAARAEEARRRAVVERDDARRDTDRVTAERDSLAAEITRGNDIIGRLQNEVQTLRAKAKVKSAVLMRQEEVVNRLETRVAELERDVRRARDRAALLEVEKDGLTEQLSSLKHKLEENAAVLASDQQVIAYLNRELNERAVNELAGATNPQSSNGRDRVARGAGTQEANLGITSGIA